MLVGIDIGGTKTAIVAGREGPDGLTVLGRAAFPTAPAERSWQVVLAAAAAEARRLVERHTDAGERLSGVGVTCGGPLDSRRGLVLSPPNLPGWDEVPVTRELGQALGCPAFLKNDANACALAEWRYGAGRGVRTMVFLTFGTGMGGGLIIDGRLYEGTNDLGGEVGHLKVAEDGPEGYGKRGSFEGFCSGGGIAKLARAAAEERLSRGERVGFCPTAGGLDAISARAVGEAAAAGDPLAREILATSGTYLGRGLALIIDIINPERIVIGSIYARCTRFLQPSMQAAIEREALPAAVRVCSVVPAELGEAIGDYACLTVAADGIWKQNGGST